MKVKFYETTWFSILMVIIFFPIGLFTMWKYTNWNKYIKIGVSVLIAISIISAIINPIKTYTATSSYTTETVAAKPAETKTLKNLETKISGEYIIGSAPKDYVSGEEKEFTTAQSGNYVAGEDFPIGVYDIVPVSGSGNVSGGGLNEIMSPNGGDFYTNYYDNKEFSEGDSLKVSGVSLKLVPQTSDDFTIPAGVYNLKAVKGSGNVSGSGLNEIMGADGGEYSVKTFDNADLNEDAKLTVTGVQLELEPKEKKVIVKEATDEIPGEKIEESYTITDEEGAIPVCTSNSEEVKCSDLKKIEELKKDVEKQEKSNEA